MHHSTLEDYKVEILLTVKTRPCLRYSHTCFEYEGIGKERNVVIFKDKLIHDFINQKVLPRAIITDMILDMFIFKNNQITLFPFFLKRLEYLKQGVVFTA